MNVGFVGLGRMGGPMADNVIAAGHTVRAYDPVEAALAPRVERGGIAAGSPAEAAEGADVVCIVVFDGDQARDVVTGAGGVLETAPGGAIVAIHTTTSVEVIEELAAAAAERGVRVVDAGVTGGETGATAGTLTTLVGGDDDAVEAARPVFEAFSADIVHAGGLGAGMTLKLARNAVGYVMMRAVHEALLLTDAQGIAPSTLRHVLATVDHGPQMLAPIDLGGPHPLPAATPDEVRGFLDHTCRLGEKDLDEALRAAARLGVTVEVIAGTRAGFRDVMRLGSAD